MRACDDSASVLRVATVVRSDGAKFCASSITSRPPSGRSPAGLRLIQANNAIWSWFTNPSRCAPSDSPTMLITDTRAR